MCKPMPVGIPTPMNLTRDAFQASDFFGYLEATVQAPAPDTPGGYIGLLPVKFNGRLVCPGGAFLVISFQRNYALLWIMGMN